MFCETAIKHGEQALGFVLITVNCGLNLFWEVAKKNIRLAHHRADAAHLKHQPLQHNRATFGIVGHEAPSLLGEINQNCARFKYCKIVCRTVNDRWDATIGINLQKGGLFLLKFA